MLGLLRRLRFAARSVIAPYRMPARCAYRVLPAIADPAPADDDEAVSHPAVGDVVEGLECQ